MEHNLNLFKYVRRTQFFKKGRRSQSFKNGRGPQSLQEWKNTSFFSNMEDNLNLNFSKIKDDLNL